MADLDDDDIPNLTESSGDEDSDVGKYLYKCYEKSVFKQPTNINQIYLDIFSNLFRLK